MLRGAWRPHSFKGLSSLLKSLITGRVAHPPELARDSTGQPIRIKQDAERIMYRHGFTILEFTGQTATASYYDNVDELPLFKEVL